jgi:hypothetical protein
MCWLRFRNLKSNENKITVEMFSYKLLFVVRAL